MDQEFVYFTLSKNVTQTQRVLEIVFLHIHVGLYKNYVIVAIDCWASYNNSRYMKM